MNNLIDEEYELILRFVETNFPKKRIKLSSSIKKAKFKKCVIVPANLNGGSRYVYNVSDKSNIGVLFMMIYDIIKNAFYGFDIELLNSAIYEHLGIKQH